MILRILLPLNTYRFSQKLSQCFQVNNDLELLRIPRNSHKFSLVF